MISLSFLCSLLDSKGASNIFVYFRVILSSIRLVFGLNKTSRVLFVVFAFVVEIQGRHQYFGGCSSDFVGVSCFSGYK
jgi:hypothetical protein